ncbi:cupin domain-containing protein [Sporomusa sp.]|uniref:cupin domain-containing protein n=1 Tax=Sporomusa sp. TaxID=2078658 RepID=UPI002C79CD8F|nr:cupin domain-containing protein [Sporomusa sp.]HWR45902.1 cupin domain-containing protein [Sporomusa sp.]
MGRFISAAVLRELAKNGKEINLEKNCVLTPSAQELVKELGLTITRGNQVLSASGNKVTNVHVQEGFDHDLKKKVQKIIEETLKPACPNPKALHVRGDQVVIQPFDQAPPGQRIGLTDVVTAKEGNLCAGFMTFDHSELPWFLNYDEADYIIEGDFMLKVGDQVFRAKAGDVVYIPKGSQVVFSSPTFCKVFYVTYPANWADFCD